MDRFVTVRRQKDFFQPTATQKKVIHGLRKMILDNGTLLVFGGSGCGKTFITKRALEGLSYIDLEHTRVDYAESPAHLVLDDVEYEGELPRSLGSTIVLSKKFIEGFQSYYEVPPLPESELLEIAEKFFEGEIETKNVKNIRTFLTDLDFSDERDTFTSPKDFVSDLFCPHGKADPWSHAGHVVMEHGCDVRDGCFHIRRLLRPTVAAGTLSAWFTKTTSTAKKTPCVFVSGATVSESVLTRAD